MIWEEPKSTIWQPLQVDPTVVRGMADRLPDATLRPLNRCRLSQRRRTVLFAWTAAAAVVAVVGTYFVVTSGSSEEQPASPATAMSGALGRPPTTAPHPAVTSNRTQESSPQPPVTPPLVTAALDFATFEPVTVSGGSGQALVPLPAGVDVALVTLTYTTDPGATLGAFLVGADDQGEAVDGFFMGAGPPAAGEEDSSFAGTGVIDRRGPLSAMSGIRVLAYGQWSLTFASIGSAPTLSIPTSGTGYTAFRYDGPQTGLLLRGEHPYVRQFTDLGMHGAGQSPVDPGVTEDTYLIAGPSIVAVEAGGEWSLTTT